MTTHVGSSSHGAASATTRPRSFLCAHRLMAQLERFLERAQQKEERATSLLAAGDSSSSSRRESTDGAALEVRRAQMARRLP
eukprot:1010273-Prymnesium_polylepis.1